MSAKHNLTINLAVPDAMSAMAFYEKEFRAVWGDVFCVPERTGENETNVRL